MFALMSGYHEVANCGDNDSHDDLDDLRVEQRTAECRQNKEVRSRTGRSRVKMRMTIATDDDECQDELDRDDDNDGGDNDDDCDDDGGKGE